MFILIYLTRILEFLLVYLNFKCIYTFKISILGQCIYGIEITLKLKILFYTPKGRIKNILENECLFNDPCINVKSLLLKIIIFH